MWKLCGNLVTKARILKQEPGANRTAVGVVEGTILKTCSTRFCKTALATPLFLPVAVSRIIGQVSTVATAKFFLIIFPHLDEFLPVHGVQTACTRSRIGSIGPLTGCCQAPQFLHIHRLKHPLSADPQSELEFALNAFESRCLHVSPYLPIVTIVMKSAMSLATSLGVPRG